MITLNLTYFNLFQLDMVLFIRQPMKYKVLTKLTTQNYFQYTVDVLPVFL